MQTNISKRAAEELEGQREKRSRPNATQVTAPFLLPDGEGDIEQLMVGDDDVADYNTARKQYIAFLQKSNRSAETSDLPCLLNTENMSTQDRCYLEMFFRAVLLVPEKLDRLPKYDIYHQAMADGKYTEGPAFSE